MSRTLSLRNLAFCAVISLSAAACDTVQWGTQGGAGNDPQSAPLVGRDDASAVQQYWSVFLANLSYHSASVRSETPAHVPASVQWKLDELPQSGRADRAPWSQSYWSHASGGVARRADGRPHPGVYLTTAEVRDLTAEGLNRLSATEKFDIYMGFLSDDPTDERHFLTTKKARAYAASENAKGFALGGLCHAWAIQAVELAEPRTVRTEPLPHLPHLTLEFTASELAALLALNQHASQSWAVRNGRYAEVGRRCPASLSTDASRPRLQNGQGCTGINAGTFHVLVTNQVGRLNHPLLVETRPDYVVLNEPLYAFEVFEEPALSRLSFSGDPAPGASSLRYFRMAAVYSVSPAEPVRNGGSRQSKTREYRYRLELSENGDIIGGTWASGEFADMRPDFVWTIALTPASESLPGVYDLYRLSQGEGVESAQGTSLSSAR